MKQEPLSKEDVMYTMELATAPENCLEYEEDAPAQPFAVIELEKLKQVVVSLVDQLYLERSNWSLNAHQIIKRKIEETFSKTLGEI